MTAPSVGAERFLLACLLGLAVGALYGFLRPLRAKHSALPDLIFLLGFGYAWLWHSFGVCLGDIRPAGFFGLLLGWYLWERTAGKWSRPLIFGFWKRIGRFFALIFLPARKFFAKIGEIIKILFAYMKKSGKIKWRRNVRSDKEKRRSVP